MGTQTGARLVYGVPLPDGTGEEEVWTKVVRDAAPDSSASRLEYQEAVLDGGRTQGFLVAMEVVAELGSPERVDQQIREVGYSHQLALRNGWQALGLNVDDMPERAWYLIAYSG